MQVAEQFNIVIEGRGLNGAEKDRYEGAVLGMVRGLSATKVGKILLSWIKHKRTHRDWVWIIPYGPENYAKWGKCNAFAWDDRWPVQIGRTQVMAAKLNFSPLNFIHNPCNADPVSGPMDVLVHELVHCERSLSWLMSDTKLTGVLAAYENEEEYFAVVYANVYASVHSVAEVGNTGLRSDHGHGVLPAADMDSAIFLSHPENYNLIRKYCDQEPGLTQEVAEVSAKFNPFRTYYQGRAKN
jgi:hypothetical protein